MAQIKQQDIAKVLKKKGFGGFAITDHDSTEAWKEAGQLNLLNFRRPR